MASSCCPKARTGISKRIEAAREKRQIRFAILAHSLQLDGVKLRYYITHVTLSGNTKGSPTADPRPANGIRAYEVHKVFLRTLLVGPCSPRRRTSCNSEKRFESPSGTALELFVRVSSVNSQ